MGVAASGPSPSASPGASRPSRRSSTGSPTTTSAGASRSPMSGRSGRRSTSIPSRAGRGSTSAGRWTGPSMRARRLDRARQAGGPGTTREHARLGSGHHCSAGRSARSPPYRVLTEAYHAAHARRRSRDRHVAGAADRRGPVASTRSDASGATCPPPHAARSAPLRPTASGAPWPGSSGTDPCATTRCCARPASGRCPSIRAAPSWRSASCSPMSAARPASPSGSPRVRSAASSRSYYRSAAVAVDENGGIVDKFLGDGVMALFIPVIAGENHAARAIDGRPGRSWRPWSVTAWSGRG